ncbi:MAG: DUF2157 domain-containing protein [Methanosarcina thermophila]|uniref:DUF2157 domain-containing protein n=1 Tax=Methanosarcina thermophila TaxID=2210 RepID=UPI0009E4F514|nr:DUF2157 domain-containing protein [Methanosarcina thermophila]
MSSGAQVKKANYCLFYNRSNIAWDWCFLFVASNWEKIGDIFRIILLAGSTVRIHYAGYYLRYENQKYPKLGFALIFLSALFFGASLFLIAQIYNINANNSTLVLVWLLGVSPLI